MPRHFASFLMALAIWAMPLVGFAQALSNRIDNVPMYGQPDTERPSTLKELDAKFISEAVAGSGSRESASNVWWRQAEEFFAQRNLDLAMRRYNQAWLLNPSSFRPYWGFARVLLEVGRPEEAIRHFERSAELVDSNFEKPALLTDTASVYTHLARRAKTAEAGQENFKRARALLEQAITADPEYGNAYKRFAFLLYYQKDYAGAWGQVKLARMRKDTQLPQAFIDELRRMLPEPQLRLTPRSSGAPTAGHQARAGGTRYIFTGPGLVSCRCRPLSSNVRPRVKQGIQLNFYCNTKSGAAASNE